MRLFRVPGGGGGGGWGLAGAVRAGYALSRPLMALIEKTPAAGAYTTLRVATAPELRGVGGEYFVHGAPVEKGPAVTREAAQALWAQTEAVALAVTGGKKGGGRAGAGKNA